MKNFVNIKYLEQNKDRVVLVDVRNNFMIPGAGKDLYNKSHIEGSFHIELSECMVGTIKEHGGRDPLPDDINTFVQKLESMGISNDTEVIAYDPAYFYAGRFWWMCKYIGLKNVKILNANESEIMASSLKFTNEVTKLPEKGNIKVEIDEFILADIDDVRKMIANKEPLLMDCRDSQRYRGDQELIDSQSGHIPTAKNYPFMNILEDGKFKDIEFIKKYFEGLENQKIVAYCGSGVSATVNLMALDELGVPARLYVGSWSDYITHKDSVIAKGVE